jgi:hypothetical protein
VYVFEKDLPALFSVGTARSVRIQEHGQKPARKGHKKVRPSLFLVTRQRIKLIDIFKRARPSTSQD